MERLHHCNQHIKPATHLAIFANHNNWPKLPTVPSAATAFFYQSSQYGHTKSPISDMQDIWDFLHQSQ